MYDEKKYYWHKCNQKIRQFWWCITPEQRFSGNEPRKYFVINITTKFMVFMIWSSNFVFWLLHYACYRYSNNPPQFSLFPVSLSLPSNQRREREHQSWHKGPGHFPNYQRRDGTTGLSSPIVEAHTQELLDTHI